MIMLAAAKGGTQAALWQYEKQLQYIGNGLANAVS
jgi:hypothetical protein